MVKYNNKPHFKNDTYEQLILILGIFEDFQID